ncbi:hypothetical protein CMUS01_11345 [Colletotrichum musicola]|uniref:Uncharacterized protein n=1 Tax=Colletotrichum musicola TaxID=2175873 RepID=A0A8H6JZ39_9PEZI|nr:hypothetical protein CMUS01_11345 [Colletotrichum musicola]
MPVPGVSIGLPAKFNFGPAPFDPKKPAEPPLEVLENFKGTFSGRGFNTIFRPNSDVTPTDVGVKPTDISDNVLELNLTAETQIFSDSLGPVPNRGLAQQPDIVLSGLPYTQAVYDVTEEPIEKPLPKNGQGLTSIHFESGLWMRVPASKGLQPSYNRMASIPHGTTINAQGFTEAEKKPGAPVFGDVDITPMFLEGGEKQPFKSQKLSNLTVRRLPPAGKLGLIKQSMLDNPNSVLVEANTGKEILSNTTFSVTTNPEGSSFGGGTSNIGFLVGDKKRRVAPNALTFDVSATYWISTVRTKLDLPEFHPQGPDDGIVVPVKASRPGEVVPSFFIKFDVPKPRTVFVKYTQIQYSQIVNLDFAPLRWPHATVATLAPVAAPLLEKDLENAN